MNVHASVGAKVELLESRQLFSIGPLTSHEAGPHLGFAVHAELGDHLKGRLPAVPAALVGLYGGYYQIYTASGAVEMDVTAIRGRQFSGLLDFISYDGSEVRGPFSATMGKSFNFTFSFRAGRTTLLTGSGSYISQSSTPGMTVLVKGGRFDGTRIPRYLPGEFSVMSGLNTIDSISV